MVAACMERRGKDVALCSEDHQETICISVPYSCLFLRFPTLRCSWRGMEEGGHLSVFGYH